MDSEFWRRNLALDETRHEISVRINILSKNLLRPRHGDCDADAVFHALDDLWDASAGSDDVAIVISEKSTLNVLIRLLQPAEYADSQLMEEVQEMVANVMVNVSNGIPGALALCRYSHPRDGVSALLLLLEGVVCPCLSP